MDPHDKVGTASPEFARMVYERRLARKTWPEVRAEFGLDKRTLIKILERYGYNHSPSGVGGENIAMWDRPCSNCGSTELRPRGLFRCKKCREGGEEYGAHDAMYHGYGTLPSMAGAHG